MQWRIQQPIVYLLQEREPTREQIVFLIDAQQSMLEPSNTPMEVTSFCLVLSLQTETEP